jgi:nucleoside-diphosphate-sugar epimerase
MADIAILGATSQIAKDYIVRALNAGHALKLFSRRPMEVEAWLGLVALTGEWNSVGYERFSEGRYDAIVNFVGSGDPARTAIMGAEIFDITEHFDRIAIDAVRQAPSTRYIFLSSGAAYGSTFLEPATEDTQAKISINAFSPQEYYSVAKLYAEARHRALADLPIIDIRVFGYFSRSADLSARFFLTDILRAIRDEQELQTGAVTMWRDYLTPDDFFALVEVVLSTPATNIALDSYTKAPVEKFNLLDAFKAEFGLVYKVTLSPPVLATTGGKPHYYTLNHRAETFGYQPLVTSLEGVLAESRALLADIESSGIKPVEN